jgi:hypothetical protein
MRKPSAPVLLLVFEPSYNLNFRRLATYQHVGLAGLLAEFANFVPVPYGLELPVWQSLQFTWGQITKSTRMLKAE